MPICLSVRPSSQKPLSLSELLLSTIEPINHRAYWPLSLSTIKPIDYQAYQQSTPQPLRIAPIDHQAYQPFSLLTIEPIAYRPWSLSIIEPINHQAYWPSSPLTTMPIDLWSSFATFKPFGLLIVLSLHFVEHFNYVANYFRPSFITTTLMFIIGNLDEKITSHLLKGKSH